MTTEAMTRFAENRPFDPFQFVTTDGPTVEVPHSDYIALDTYATAFLIFADSGHVEVFDTAQVVSIKSLHSVD